MLTTLVQTAPSSATDTLARYLLWPTFKFIIALIVVLTMVAVMTLIERRVLAFMQARLGPNRVGPYGLFQFIADAVKLLLKEDIMPAGAQKLAYFIAPMLPMIPALVVFTLIPFGPPPTFTVTSVNVGLLLVLADVMGVRVVPEQVRLVWHPCEQRG